LTGRSSCPDDDGPMALLIREPPEPADPPGPVCLRCSKPVTPGTAAQIAGRAVHMRCLAWGTQLDAVEQQDRAGRDTRRAQAAIARAELLLDRAREYQTTCPVCGLLVSGNPIIPTWGKRNLPTPPDRGAWK
jgi:hypothetical protein